MQHPKKKVSFAGNEHLAGAIAVRDRGWIANIVPAVPSLLSSNLRVGYI